MARSPLLLLPLALDLSINSYTMVSNSPSLCVFGTQTQFGRLMLLTVRVEAYDPKPTSGGRSEEQGHLAGWFPDDWKAEP